MKHTHTTSRILWVPTIVVILVSLVIAGLLLFLMGRSLICSCGYVKLWDGDIWGNGNSQHISDWYLFSHVIHGFVFYFLFRRILHFAPTHVQLLGAIVLETAWELLENSPLIIDRYRMNTSSVSYYGDSVLNSLCDIGWMIAGFAFASRVKWQFVFVTALFFELLSTWIVRDGLILNIIMLVYPTPAIRNWQLLLHP